MSSSCVAVSNTFATMMGRLSVMVLPGVGDRSEIVGAARSIRRLKDTSRLSESGALPGLTKNANGAMPSAVDDGRSQAILNLLYEFAPTTAGMFVAETGAAPVARIVVVRLNVVVPPGTLQPWTAIR